MNPVDAIYQDGVFKPLKAVGLAENQRVQLRIQPMETGDAAAWFAAVQDPKQGIVTQRGYFPDSTVDIAEDRRR